jgi:hypothetical protein
MLEGGTGERVHQVFSLRPASGVEGDAALGLSGRSGISAADERRHGQEQDRQDP